MRSQGWQREDVETVYFLLREPLVAHSERQGPMWQGLGGIWAVRCGPTHQERCWVFTDATGSSNSPLWPPGSLVGRLHWIHAGVCSGVPPFRAFIRPCTLKKYVCRHGGVCLRLIVLWRTRERGRHEEGKQRWRERERGAWTGACVHALCMCAYDISPFAASSFPSLLSVTAHF